MTQAVWGLSDSQAYPAPAWCSSSPISSRSRPASEVARALRQERGVSWAALLIIGILPCCMCAGPLLGFIMPGSGGAQATMALSTTANAGHVDRELRSCAPSCWAPTKPFPTEARHEHRHDDADPGNEGYFRAPQLAGLAVCALALAGGLFALQRYGAHMDVKRKGHPARLHPRRHLAGWFWRPLRLLMLVVAGCSLLAIGWVPEQWRGRSGARRDGVRPQIFPLQPVRHPVDEHAVLHEHGLHRIGIVRAQARARQMRIGSRIAWAAVALALIGTMVRWYESYQIGPDIGHIPVSNSTRCSSCSVG